MKYFISALCLFIFFMPAAGQSDAVSLSPIDRLEAIKSTPDSLIFKNTFDLPANGGHLQGIQTLRFRDTEYFVLSGSSDSASYFTVIKTGQDNMIVSINKILGPPFKHAGGFQIWGNLMAIGAEDDEAKNRSKIFIYKLDNPGKSPQEPVAIIDRYGTYKRGTAGCVAVTGQDDQMLLAVGDWDTENLDFYRFDSNKLYEEGTNLQPEYSLKLKKTDKSDWSDRNLLSYQNINFIRDNDAQLYLAGMATNPEGDNILDLFRVDSPDSAVYALSKVFTKSFPKNPRTSFKWGAGISINAHGELSIFSTEENIDSTSLIYIYK